MAGMAGFFLLFFYVFLDATDWQPSFMQRTVKVHKTNVGVTDVAAPLTWVGMNTMLIYLLSSVLVQTKHGLIIPPVFRYLEDL